MISSDNEESHTIARWFMRPEGSGEMDRTFSFARERKAVVYATNGLGEMDRTCFCPMKERPCIIPGTATNGVRLRGEEDLARSLLADRLIGKEKTKINIHFFYI